MVSGIILVSSSFAAFDYGATHSFVSIKFAKKHSLMCVPLDIVLSIDALIGVEKIIMHDYKSCIVNIDGRELSVDLIKLEKTDFNIILGMNWLAMTPLIFIERLWIFISQVVRLNLDFMVALLILFPL